MSAKMKNWAVSGLMMAAVSAAPSVAQQTSQPAPATTNATAPAEGPLNLLITAVKGRVQYRTPGAAGWEYVKVGQELPEGTEFSTKTSSRVQFTIPTDQVFAVDQLTRVKITRASFVNGKLVTDAGMKFGRVRYDIQGAGVEHDATIRSPNATLAVRGTQVSLYDQPPFTPRAISLTGTAQFRDLRKSIPFGGKGAGKTTVTTAVQSPVQFALQQAVVDPNLQRARTASEQVLIAQFIARGATTFYDQNRGIEVIRGGTPPSDRFLARELSGLDIFLSWTGNADLNLSVGAQTANEFLYPAAGINAYPNGDHIPFDHQGGPHGGIEVANFPGVTANSSELYFVGATHISGATTDMKFSAFMNGKQITIFDLGTQSFVPTVTGTLGPGQANATQVAIGQAAIILMLGNGGGGNPFPPPQGGLAVHAAHPTHAAPAEWRRQEVAASAAVPSAHPAPAPMGRAGR